MRRQTVSAEELLAEEYDGPEADPTPGPADDSPRLRVVNVAELLSAPAPPRELQLSPWLARQSIAMVHAYRGRGKTHFVMGAAIALAGGGRFLRFDAPRPFRVLILDGEMPLCVMQERMAAHMAGADFDVEPSNLRIITPDLQDRPIPDLASLSGQAAIEEHLADVDVLFIDNISTSFRAGVENEAESWGPVQEWVLKLRRHGLTTVLVHHSGKTGLQRGTSKREDVLDVVIGLRLPGDYEAKEGARFVVHFEKHRSFYGTDAEPFEAHLITDEHGRATWTMRNIEEVITERVAAMVGDKVSMRDIAKELGIGLATVQRHKEKAAKKGLL